MSVMLPAVQMRPLPGAAPLSRSRIEPYVFSRRYESEKKKHPFSTKHLGKINPYTELAVSSEFDYYEYLREHTYLMLCDELIETQTQEIRESAQNEIDWFREQNEYLKKSDSEAQAKLSRARRFIFALSVLLIIGFFACIILRNNAYRSGLSYRSAENSAKYDEGYSDGRAAGYSDGYQDGFSDGSSAADNRSSGSRSSSVSSSSDSNVRTVTRTNTGGSHRDDPIADAYIGNKKSKKFHLPTCSYLPDQSNQITFDSRDEAIAAGYSPCGHCHP